MTSACRVLSYLFISLKPIRDLTKPGTVFRLFKKFSSYLFINYNFGVKFLPSFFSVKSSFGTFHLCNYTSNIIIILILYNLKFTCFNLFPPPENNNCSTELFCFQPYYFTDKIFFIWKPKKIYDLYFPVGAF